MILEGLGATKKCTMPLIAAEGRRIPSTAVQTIFPVLLTKAAAVAMSEFLGFEDVETTNVF